MPDTFVFDVQGVI